jgi:hypothetical protein
MSENTRKARLAAAIAARKEAGQNMFNPEVQLKRVKISNLVEAPGEISYIPISNKTKKMNKINRLSQQNKRQVERYGLLPQNKGVILPSDPVFRAENLANTQSTKSSSTPNRWFETGNSYLIKRGSNPEEAKIFGNEIHAKQMARNRPSFSCLGGDCPRVESPVTVTNPLQMGSTSSYPVGRGKRGGSSKTRKLKRATGKGATNKIKSSKH